MKVEHQNLSTEKAGTVTLVTPTGDIDMHESPKLRKVVLEAIAKKPTTVLIDLAKVGFIDSSGVATLVEALKTSKSGGIQLILCGMSTKVLDVFELSRLDKIFKIVPTTKDVLGK
jgi:anti-sigma B factor antagonist